jgi:hypothetical protein
MFNQEWPMGMVYEAIVVGIVYVFLIVLTIGGIASLIFKWGYNKGVEDGKK